MKKEKTSNLSEQHETQPTTRTFNINQPQTKKYPKNVIKTAQYTLYLTHIF